MKNLSLKNIALVALIIIAGVFLFSSSRSDSPSLTADISSSEAEGIESFKGAESQESPSAQPQTETAEAEQVAENTIPAPPPAANTAVQDDQPAEEPSPVADPEQTQENGSEQSSTLISIAVDPVSVKPGENITITVSAPGEIFSIIQIDVYLESPTAQSTVSGSTVNINGDGNRFGSILIPKDAEQGTWKIRKVEIRDNTGSTTSYHYGIDIFATFNVTS